MNRSTVLGAFLLIGVITHVSWGWPVKKHTPAQEVSLEMKEEPVDEYPVKARLDKNHKEEYPVFEKLLDLAFVQDSGEDIVKREVAANNKGGPVKKYPANARLDKNREEKYPVFEKLLDLAYVQDSGEDIVKREVAANNKGDEYPVPVNARLNKNGKEEYPVFEKLLDLAYVQDSGEDIVKREVAANNEVRPLYVDSSEMEKKYPVNARVDKNRKEEYPVFEKLLDLAFVQDSGEDIVKREVAANNEGDEHTVKKYPVNAPLDNNRQEEYPVFEKLLDLAYVQDSGEDIVKREVAANNEGGPVYIDSLEMEKESVDEYPVKKYHVNTRLYKNRKEEYPVFEKLLDLAFVQDSGEDIVKREVPANNENDDYAKLEEFFNTLVKHKPETEQEASEIQQLLDEYGIDVNEDEESVANANQQFLDQYLVDLDKDGNQTQRKIVWQ